MLTFPPMNKLVAALFVLFVVCTACARQEGQPGDTSATTGTNATAPGSPAESGTATPNTNTNPPADAAPAPTSAIADGQAVYRAHCVSCHGADGKKQTGSLILVSAETQARADSDLARAIRENQAHRGLILTESDVTAVAAYVKALR